MDYFSCIYLVVASLVALFHAFVMPILGVGGMEQYNPLPWYDKIRKFIEQFSSSVIGFGLFYFLIEKSIYVVSAKQYALINIADVLLLVIALLGISGFLSFAVYSTATNITAIFRK